MLRAVAWSVTHNTIQNLVLRMFPEWASKEYRTRCFSHCLLTTNFRKVMSFSTRDLKRTGNKRKKRMRLPLSHKSWRSSINLCSLTKIYCLQKGKRSSEMNCVFHSNQQNIISNRQLFSIYQRRNCRIVVRTMSTIFEVSYYRWKHST